MPKLQPTYDVVVIGAGLGGLLCAHILCNEGKSVCVLEKNAQIGGNLQTFKRDRVKFDTGVHYIGGLKPGQVLHKYLSYFNVLNRLDLIPLDQDGYDRISFANDAISYPHGQGYENFVHQLAKIFPDQRAGLEKYIATIKNLVSEFELYNLDRDFENVNEMPFFSLSAKEVIESCVSDPKLQQVLGGSNMLYAGVGKTAPFYAHALIIDSYINGAYKLKHSDQLSNLLRKDLKAMGVDILINHEVVKIENDAQRAEAVILQNGKRVEAEIFISNLHPTPTFNLLNTRVLRKANVQRMQQLKNTISAFMLYIKLKPNVRKYNGHNKYHFFQDDVWNVPEYDSDQWLKGVAVFNSPNPENPEYAISTTIMAYMKYEEVQQWEKSFNTTLSENDRGAAYLAFKEQKAQELFAAIETFMPGIKADTESYYTATPLTQRDYTGSAEGAVYGILHDYNQPLQTLVRPNTKLKNLFLTGQNIILHGVLGVTIGAVVTCQHILGKKYVLDKIKAAVQDKE